MRPFAREICFCLGAALLLADSALGAAWNEVVGGRWTVLEVPRQGEAGFSLLSPQQTGLNFTNKLDELRSASNRVLEDGGGVAIGDFDQDGRPDIFFCGLEQSVLYRNCGGWRFEDWTQEAGLALTNYVCRGAVFADINGDRWPDLLVSALGRGVLCFSNDGAGQFVNRTSLAGTETRSGSMTLALADVDGDGTLDLYVANYRTEDIRDQSRIEVRTINGRTVLAPQYEGRLMLVGGQVFELGEPDFLYFNNGHGRFSPVPWTGGRFLDEEGQPITSPPRDWGLTATFRDITGDGLPDLYVCNDYWTPDRIWINQGKGIFRLIPRHAIRHTSENSMGVDVADVDRDGHMDIFVVDMLSREPATRKRQVLAQTPMPVSPGEILNRPQIMRNTLFHNRGDNTFEEVADYAGVPASEWSWQALFLDVDLDGYEDLLIPAGHTRDVQDLDATKRIQALQHPWPKDMTPKERQEAFTVEMAVHARLYPPLPLPILAFRNRRDLRFEEVTVKWGTENLGVHQGTAYGDLDGDGDLDLAVNNLNGVCGIYRNNSPAPRVAVRLKGLPPNTAGIGALVTLRGGAVPVQSQEVVSGGRYVSGCESLLTFAAGTSTNTMMLEVRWRNGTTTSLAGIRANRLYEVDESVASASRREERFEAEEVPLFSDATHLLRHKHLENHFDDSTRQPLLPKSMSRLGPGLAWHDFDSDGDDDLVIGSGAGGSLGVFRNTGKGRFERFPESRVERDITSVVTLRKANGQTVSMLGEASYERNGSLEPSVSEYDPSSGAVKAALPGFSSSTGPLAAADIDGDGVLELFVGGRVVPGRYPEPASSRIFRQQGDGWGLDAENSRKLVQAGMVSGAVWSDLDLDGFPELLLACEWGPIRIFSNHHGRLDDATRAWGMEAYSGWWSSVTTGDFNGDGLMDIVAGNWGLNSSYQASSSQPLQIYFGDFTEQGRLDLIETEYDRVRNLVAPRHRLDTASRGLPLLLAHFRTFRAYSEAGIGQVLEMLPATAYLTEARTLASMVFINKGGRFEARELPREAQLAPVFGICVADFDGDGCEDAFLSQNFFALPWEQPRLDAGRSLLLRGDGRGRFTALSARESGLEVYGEQRGAAVADFDQDGRPDLAVTQNGAETRLYRNQRGEPGVRVRLRGPPGNSSAVGAVVRFRVAEAWGSAREVHAGSGYWSQDSAILVFSAGAATEARVHWPGGRTTTRPISSASGIVELHWSDP